MAVLSVLKAARIAQPSLPRTREHAGIQPRRSQATSRRSPSIALAAQPRQHVPSGNESRRLEASSSSSPGASRTTAADTPRRSLPVPLLPAALLPLIMTSPAAAAALISESQHAVDSLAADHMIATSSSSQFFLASLPDLSTVLNLFPNFDFESAVDTWQDVAFALQDNVDEFLYLASHLAESHDLAALSPATLAIIYVAGLLTSFAPCTLSLLPLTVGFIAGFDSPPAAPSPPQSASASLSSPPPCCCSAEDSPPPLPDAPSARAASVPVNCFFFTLGLAATRTAMGVAAALAGQHAVGDVGGALPAAVSLVAMLAGLHLLGLLPVRLPAPVAARFSPSAVSGRVPVALQMAAGGAAFAFVASPCCTPVLASLLAFVASTRDAVTGGALLLSYTMGFATPLLLAASCTGALKQISAVRRYSGWINPASGALLLGGGAYVFVGKVLPHAAVMSTIM